MSHCVFSTLSKYSTRCYLLTSHFQLLRGISSPPCVCARSGNQDLCNSLVTLNKLQKLHFGGHGLAACGSDVLRAAVQHATTLRHLAVDFAISNAGVAHLAPSLQHSVALSSLHLSAAAVGDAGAAALALPLQHNQALVELDLSRVCLVALLQVLVGQKSLCTSNGIRRRDQIARQCMSKRQGSLCVHTREANLLCRTPLDSRELLHSALHYHATGR